MTPQDHYRIAEEILEDVRRGAEATKKDAPKASAAGLQLTVSLLSVLTATAQVHAQLALAPYTMQVKAS